MNNSILFISLSNIGDAVMTTPVLQSLHQSCPMAVIDIVADARSRPVFEYCPYRGELFIKDKRSFLRGVPGLLGKLRHHYYDLIVDLRTDGLTLFLKGKVKLTKRHGLNCGPHAVEQHMGVINQITGDRPIPACNLWISPDEEAYASNHLQGLADKRLLALCPGANSQKKIWDWRKYQDLLGLLSDSFDTVVLLGDRRDRVCAEKIIAVNSMQVINLCGETSVLQAAAVLKYADLFIGNDSGLGHIAAAMKIPACTLFGPGQPDRYHPWGGKCIWLTGQDNDINTLTPSQVKQCLVKNEFISQ